ncbi:MAG TPA: tyrosine-type recombinase/integrase [Candidatus Polarisedimenticolia bacterium]|jgi:integrase
MAIYKRRMLNGRKTRHYFYDFTFRGKRHKGCTSLRGKEKAREFEDAIRARLRLKSKGIEDPNICPTLDPPVETAMPTFKQYGLAFLEGAGAQKKSKADDQSILDRALTPFFGKMSLDAITRADVERFRNDRLAGKLYDEETSRKEKPSPQTVKNELGLLKRILTVAVDDDLLPKNPATKIKLQRFSNRRGRVIDPEEFGRLLLAVSPHKGAHLRPVMTLAYETGMREGEILSLKWADVDFKRHTVTVRETKTAEDRTIDLSERAERALRAWGRKDDTYIFPALKGKGHLGHVSHAFARLAARAEVQDVVFHDFRHTFCSRKRDEGADVIILKAITGHKTLAMLERYTHPSEKAKRELMRGPDVEPAPTPKPPHTEDPAETKAAGGIA